MAHNVFQPRTGSVVTVTVTVNVNINDAILRGTLYYGHLRTRHLDQEDSENSSPLMAVFSWTETQLNTRSLGGLCGQALEYNDGLWLACLISPQGSR